MSVYSLKHCSKTLKSDPKFVLELVKKDGLELEYADKKLRNQKNIVMEAVKQNGLSLDFASQKLRSDIEICLEAVKQNPQSFKYCSEEIKTKKEVYEIALLYPRNLELLNHKILFEKSYYLKVLSIDPLSLQYAPEFVKDDIEILEKLININPECIKYAKVKFRKDPYLIEKILSKDGLALKHVQIPYLEIPENEWISLYVMAVEQNGLALEFVKHRADVIVQKAILQNPMSLKFVSRDFWFTSNQIYEQCLISNPLSFQYFPFRKIRDANLIEKAIKLEPKNYQFLELEKRDEDIALYCCEKDASNYNFLPPNLKTDYRFIVFANSDILKFIQKMKTKEDMKFVFN